MTMHQHLFLLSTPFSGSTLLHKIIATSPNVSQLPCEGQHVVEVRNIMRGSHWNPAYQVPWGKVKPVWYRYWDLGKRILLEKSPPNLLRAAAIQSQFNHCSFIVLIRDPYAFCEGIDRRGNDYDVKKGAELWKLCAEHQIWNIQNLDHVIWTTYEDLTGQTDALMERLLEFMPHLDRLTHAGIDTFSVLGRQGNIENLNSVKIRMLRPRQIERINDVLMNEQHLLAFFGYRLLDPDRHSLLGSYQARLSAWVVRSRRHIRRQLGSLSQVGRSSATGMSLRTPGTE